MPVRVGMYEGALKRMRDRIDPLKLDIDIVTFDNEGKFAIGGKALAPEETDLDYLWLSPDVAGGSLGNLPFDVALRCRSVKVLQTFNAGLDNPVYKKISDKGTRICNSSAQSVAIAEYVMAHALALIHPVDLQREQQARKEWKRTPFREVSRMKWLVVGFGPIGQEVAKRAKAFGANTMVVRRSPKTSEIADQAGTLADLPKFLPEADVVVLACALNNETRKFADDGFFKALKPGAILVNIARGALIDDDAMLAALDRGQLAAAALDVFDPEPLPTDNPLWSHPKVRLTPHTSFAGDGTRLRWDDLFIDNLPRYVRGEKLANEVDPADIV